MDNTEDLAGSPPEGHITCGENRKAEGWSAQWWKTSPSARKSEFHSRAGQIGHSVATAAMFLRCCVVQALRRGDGPRHLLHAST